MHRMQCDAEPIAPPARMSSSGRDAHRSSVSVATRRAMQRTRTTVRSQIVRTRRARFALTHLQRQGVPESRLARPIDLAARVGSAVRPEHFNVATGQILIGGEAGISGRRLAAELSDPLRPSRRLVDGALAELIYRHQTEGDGILTNSALRETALYREAAVCMRVTGRYHGAMSDEDLMIHLRDLATGQGARSEPVVVRRVKHSDCYELQETGTSVACALANRDAALQVVVLPGAVTTPLQDLLIQMSWLAGDRQLYQPIPTPDLETWPLVRQCSDRLAMMRAFLDGPRTGSTHSYLDVASCYGWFVAQMLELGYDAFGVERDGLAVKCGQWAYNLDPHRVTSADAEPFLRDTQRRFDVVSCFSLLHHAVVAGDGSAVRLIRRLDAITGQVLFLDTGEMHETWLRDVLPGWSPEFIAGWIRRHTKFAEVTALGTDRDRRPPNGDNYGRTLFACIR
jgi:hypothetical protein